MPSFHYHFVPQADPTPIFKRMAMKVLGEMACREFPLSSRFKHLLGPAYASDAGEATESSEEEVSSGEEESAEVVGVVGLQ